MVSHPVSESLLPYLDSRSSKIWLHIPPCNKYSRATGIHAPPFLLIDDAHQLTRLFEARLVTDAGGELKRVFLLVQRDNYRMGRDSLSPLTNPDVDALWQRSFDFYKEKANEGSLLVLAAQVDSSGALVYLRSLFFCRHREVFFHPPCPVCGTLLEQCRDDDLLRGLRLRPYTGSLARYLYCPECLSSSGKTDFYAPAAHNDPRIVKDCKELIDGFGRLAANGQFPAAFPCVDCPEMGNCHGGGGKALDRIVPFSFHPFFMLIFDAATVSAPDFLALLSGAPMAELKGRLRESEVDGRLGDLPKPDSANGEELLFFSPRNHEEHFLEVLYLKLSFLKACARTVWSQLGLFKPPNLDFSIDRLWVDLPHGGTLLPLFWNFRLRFLGTLGDGLESPLPDAMHASYGMHLLGRLWFYGLLANRRQGVSELYAALREAGRKMASTEGTTFHDLLRSRRSQAFSHGNVFWNPSGTPIREDSEQLWQRALFMGWALLTNAAGTDVGMAMESFGREVDLLREDIRTRLFPRMSAALPIQERGAEWAENAGIRRILDAIKAARPAPTSPVWEGAAQTLLQKAARDTRLAETLIVPDDSPGELAETVIPGSGTAVPGGPPTIQSRDEGGLASTVVLEPSREKAVRGQAPWPHETEDEQDLPQTIVLRGQGQDAHCRGELPADGGENATAMKPDPVSAGKGAGHARDGVTGAQPEEESLLTETVILRTDPFGKRK